MTTKCCREQLSPVCLGFGVTGLAGCWRLPPRRSWVSIRILECWGAAEGPRLSPAPACGIVPWGDDAPALYPSRAPKMQGRDGTDSKPAALALSIPTPLSLLSQMQNIAKTFLK